MGRLIAARHVRRAVGGRGDIVLMAAVTGVGVGVLQTLTWPLRVVLLRRGLEARGATGETAQ
jgi:hypothetical protein